ncbi:MAG: hypothetical protein JXQ87_00900 [Bacteroidia bacterium]
MIATLFSFAEQSFAQLSLNLGYGNHFFQDQGHSPFVYSAGARRLGAQYEWTNEKSEWGISIDRSKKELTPQLDFDDKYELNLANRDLMVGQVNWKRKINSKNYNAWIGARLLTHYDFVPYNHSANNLVSYELTNALAPVLEIRFDLNKKWELQLQASFPLVVASIRPEPLGLFPLENFDVSASDILTSISVQSVNRVFYLDNTASMKYETEHREISFGLHYFGGYNRFAEHKGHVFHSVFVNVPLRFNK